MSGNDVVAATPILITAGVATLDFDPDLSATVAASGTAGWGRRAGAVAAWKNATTSSPTERGVLRPSETAETAADSRDEHAARPVRHCRMIRPVPGPRGAAAG